MKAGKRVFASDSHWVPPLNMEIKDRLTLDALARELFAMPAFLRWLSALVAD